MFKTRSFDRIIRLREKVRKMFFPVDRKTVGFILKISKEIGAWRKSLKREARGLTRP